VRYTTTLLVRSTDRLAAKLRHVLRTPGMVVGEAAEPLAADPRIAEANPAPITTNA
jgi:hypothetical protein